MIDNEERKQLLNLNVVMHYPRDDAIDMRFQEDVSSPSLQTTISTGKAATIMTNSAGSAIDDSTPSDSGVQLMGSMSSDMNESFMSNFGLDYDGNYSTAIATPALTEACKQIYQDEFKGALELPLPGVDMAVKPDGMANVCEIDANAMTRSDIDNSNIDFDMITANTDIPDAMKTSTCSTFDTDAIVYRRKTKKTRTNSTNSTNGSVKKRVSFHEDILKNTRTDNIHIEHGFITYKGHPKKVPYRYLRNSWCSQGQCEDYAVEVGNACYRNACSDVLDYGQTDIFEHSDTKWNKSGVFEYAKANPTEQQPKHAPVRKAVSNDERTFFQCKCSDSDSSSDTAENSDSNDVRRTDYSRTKSRSCDCIERNDSNRLNNNEEQNMADNCYYSEPCFETMSEYDSEANVEKSVWCKELKPKSSCLKKTRCDTAVILEHDVDTKVKKFNVHQLPDVNHLFGSLKNIFTIPIPERGVPEGCEDLHNVVECVPEIDSPMKSPIDLIKTAPPSVERIDTPNDSPTSAKRKALSLFPIPFEDEMAQVAIADDTTNIDSSPLAQNRPNTFRNKFIVNCESTVFEHTGVSFENRDASESVPDIPNSSSNCVTPQKQSKSILSFASAPFRKKLSNIFSSFRDLSNSTMSTTSTATTPSPRSASIQQEQLQAQLKKFQTDQMSRSWNSSYDYQSNKMSLFDADASMTSSIISNSSDKHSIMSSSTITTSTHQSTSNQDRVDGHIDLDAPILSDAIQTSSNPESPIKTKHLASPMRRKSVTSTFDRAKLSPDLFCGQKSSATNPLILLSEEFDDLLTVTTTTDTETTENDIEMVDYATAVNEAKSMAAQLKAHEQRNKSCQLLRPPSSKSSLINRFLRNVTQKKINDATVKKNINLSYRYKDSPRPFSNLYVKPKRPINQDVMADFNAEIALEMEAHEQILDDVKENVSEIETPINAREDICIGVGEVSIDNFDIEQLHILRDSSEKLIKAFKLYTGYTLHGHMTPVLVFLTDKTLYVTDLVRNRLCNKFVLPYSELDVVLIGPHGNTVLLSNSARDMQQVLLAGGPYPADGLVSSLEMCSRRAGTKLPAIGQLTFDHLAPLQKFVQEKCSVSKNDAWIYYAVVSVPANILPYEDEPLGPSMKGPLMHRTIPLTGDQSKQQWSAGYFLLKAGVLYMFSDGNRKLPSMVVAITECKCARRNVTSQRPHCFEIMLKSTILQLAAPDEYVASEWLQTVVQSATGLFEHQERHKTLGCTLVITSNHLITLREDFSSPLRRLNSKGAIETNAAAKPQLCSESVTMDRKMSISTISDSTMNDVCSNLSTSSRRSDLGSSRNTPMRTLKNSSMEEKSFTSISSIYGKNSGVEIKSCASIQEMISVRIPPQNNQWWCILEFSCQEVRDCSDDMVIFFATNSDMRRFLSILETVWHTKNSSSFPQSILSERDTITSHGSNLFSSLNRSWEPLLAAAFGYPQ